jgi:hypothetical protein
MLPDKWPAYALAPLLVLIASCTGVPAPKGAPPVAASAEMPTAGKAAGAVDYRIDAAHSSLRVLVYRGGPLAALGHNHVILDNNLAGWIRAGKTPKTSSFYLQLALADFVIDPPAARAQEGADFADEVDDSARTGTRRNMLGAALLNAERFPLVQIESDSVRGSAPETPSAWSAAVRITIAGRTRLVSVPFTLQREPGSAHVTADFWLPQSTLGLTPFSALLGGLQVADDMHLKLEVQATSDQAVGLD